MRNMDEMLEEVRSKADAISQDEQKKFRNAQEHYQLTRELRDKALAYRRSATYLEEDNASTNIVAAYNDLARAFEECAAQHLYAGDQLCLRLAQRNKTFTINTEE